MGASDLSEIGNTKSDNHFRVVVIAGNEKELNSYSRALEEHFDVVSLQDNSEVTALLKKKTLPDVFLIDTLLPQDEVSALCQTTQANQNTRNTPIMVLSEVNEPEVRANAFDAGASDYIVKPIIVPELVSRLRLHASQYRRTVDLETLIDIDPLTHLPNATKFSEILKQEWLRCARYWHHLSLLLIRLENIEIYEENHNRDQYYALIASLADALSSIGARPGDVLASLNENCFALALSDCSTEGARLKAEQIMNVLSKSNIYAKARSPHDLTCRIAIGIAAPAVGGSCEELFNAAQELFDKNEQNDSSKFLEFDEIMGTV